MTDILSLIEKRKEIYHQETKKIIALFEEKLNKAMQYMMKDDRAITWFSLETIPDLVDYVYLKGHFQTRLFDVLIINGEKVTITEEKLRENPNFLLKLMLPIKMLESGTSEDIYKAISDYMQLNRLTESDKLEEAIKNSKSENLSELMEDEQFIDEITRPKEFMGFDIENLSDEKIKQLMFSALLMTESKN